VGRQLNFPVSGVNDIVSWLCAASAFLAMAHAFKHGDFVRVSLLLEKVSPRVRRTLELASLAIACVAIGYLAWWATRFTYESWEFNDMANGLLALPLWIPQTTFMVGSWLFFIAVLDEMVLVARGARPTYVVAVEERHAPWRLLRRRLNPPYPEAPNGHPRSSGALLLAIMLLLLDRRRLDRDDAGHRRLDRPGLLHNTMPGKNLFLRLLGDPTRRGSWPRCRCSSGWARSCSAPSSARRCSSGLRPWLEPWCPGG
jgi:TRAP-type C4-dicarboxylate transport system permease small subunit